MGECERENEEGEGEGETHTKTFAAKLPPAFCWSTISIK